MLTHLPVSDVDPTPFEVTTIEQAMMTLVEDVVAGVRSLGAVLEARDVAAAAAFVEHASAVAIADAPAALVALETAAESLLGEGFGIVPRFVVPAGSAAEWTQALGDQAGLLAHLAASGRDFPVEDWTHSAARVREPVRHLEQAGLAKPKKPDLPASISRLIGPRTGLAVNSMKKLRRFCCLRVNSRSAKKSAAAANSSTLPSDVPASDPVLAWLDVTAGITSIIFSLSL